MSVYNQSIEISLEKTTNKIIIDKGCDGCGYCVNAFECPAIIFDREKNRADIDPSTCVNCGQCLSVCGKGHIVKTAAES